MELKTVLRKYWILAFFVAVGFYDFFDNHSINSLIGAIVIMIYLVLISRPYNISQRTFGFFVLGFSIWGLVDSLFIKSKIPFAPLIIQISMFFTGIVMILNKLEQLINNIKTQKVYQFVIAGVILSMFYVTFLYQIEIGIMEILILVVATITALLVLLPEKKKN